MIAIFNNVKDLDKLREIYIRNYKTEPNRIAMSWFTYEYLKFVASVNIGFVCNSKDCKILGMKIVVRNDLNDKIVDVYKEEDM